MYTYNGVLRRGGDSRTLAQPNAVTAKKTKTYMGTTFYGFSREETLGKALCTVYMRRGAVGRVSDLRSRGRGFESRPGTRRKNSGHVSHTCVPLFTKQYKLVPAKGR